MLVTARHFDPSLIFVSSVQSPPLKWIPALLTNIKLEQLLLVPYNFLICATVLWLFFTVSHFHPSFISVSSVGLHSKGEL
jgi:hypothetical protein